METPFKPIGYFKKDLKSGIYFKSGNDVATDYLIELLEGRCEGNAHVKIYITGCPENHFKTDGLVNGSKIIFPKYDTEQIASIDLWQKYYFPKFNNKLQLYYDGKKYFNDKRASDSLVSLVECMNFAIEHGLNKYNIKPY